MLWSTGIGLNSFDSARRVGLLGTGRPDGEPWRPAYQPCVKSETVSMCTVEHIGRASGGPGTRLRGPGTTGLAPGSRGRDLSHPEGQQGRCSTGQAPGESPMASPHPDPPADGAKITVQKREAERARSPDHPVHRGRRHRPGHLARQRAASSTRPSRRPTAAGARSSGWRCTPARRRTRCSAPGCPTRPSRPSAITSSASRAR